MTAETSRRSKPRYVPRFAGEAFAHQGNPPDGPDLRALTSQVAWKQSPSAAVNGKLSQ